jgi:D-3-phosphoglycerate dehydrogenase
VNAPKLAAERGIAVRDTKTTTTQNFVNLITIRAGGHAIAGTLAGLKGEPRIVMVDDHNVDLPPARNMLIVHNRDEPGVIGLVGRVLGEAGVNIDDMDVGRAPDGQAAMMVLATGTPVPPAAQERLRSDRLVDSVHAVELGPA